MIIMMITHFLKYHFMLYLFQTQNNVKFLHLVTQLSEVVTDAV